MKNRTPRSPKSRSAQVSRNKRSDQLNKNNDAFWRSRGYPGRPADWRSTPPTPRKPR